jgi:hypothetical protein
MCESLTRVEELPSGKRVFYIDVGNIPDEHVEHYMERMRRALGPNEQTSYVLPVFPNKPPVLPSESVYRVENYFLIAVIIVQAFVLGLSLLIK